MAEPVPDPATLPRHITIVDGELLREARRRHHVSQETLAWDAGISITTITDLERRPPVPRRCRTRTLARLAAALGEPPAALVPPHMAAALGLTDSGDVPIADQPDQPAEPATGSGPGAMPA
jgi:DNA-binding XRE family transcriptional regulator